MSEIFTARLISGDQIIGEVKVEDPEYVYLEKALLVGMVDRVNGQVGIGFGPVSPLAPRGDKGHSVKLNKSSILLQVDFESEIIDSYKEAVSSIVIASAFGR